MKKVDPYDICIYAHGLHVGHLLRAPRIDAKCDPEIDRRTKTFLFEVRSPKNVPRVPKGTNFGLQLGGGSNEPACASPVCLLGPKWPQDPSQTSFFTIVHDLCMIWDRFFLNVGPFLRRVLELGERCKRPQKRIAIVAPYICTCTKPIL